jgi:hypothetical protein
MIRAGAPQSSVWSPSFSVVLGTVVPLTLGGRRHNGMNRRKQGNWRVLGSAILFLGCVPLSHSRPPDHARAVLILMSDVKPFLPGETTLSYSPLPSATLRYSELHPATPPHGANE